MPEFEPMSSGFRCDHSAKCSTITAQIYLVFVSLDYVLLRRKDKFWQEKAEQHLLVRWTLQFANFGQSICGSYLWSRLG